MEDLPEEKLPPPGYSCLIIPWREELVGLQSMGLTESDTVEHVHNGGGTHMVGAAVRSYTGIFEKIGMEATVFKGC